MLHVPTRLRVGDVVLCEAVRGVVWRYTSDGAFVWLLPVMNAGDMRHRSDVAVSEFREMVQCGIGGLDLVVRPGNACRMPSRSQKRIGRLSDHLLTEIGRAVKRECAASRTEAKWRPLAV